MTINKIFLLSIILSGRLAFAQNISSSPDTIVYEMDGNPLPWLIQDDKAYCFFERDVYSGYQDHRFLIIDLSNGEATQVPTPPDLNKHYKDLFVRNGRVYTIDYYKGITFLLDENQNQWLKVANGDDLVYEDEDYYVTSLDFGEWGGHTWFRNKKTGEEYVIHVAHPIVNRLKNTYYLTTSQAVIKVENPKELLKCGLDNNYKNVKNIDFYPPDAEYGSNGFVYAFRDTSFWIDPAIFIATSFVQDNELYHICSNDSISYCAILEAGILEPIFYFESGMKPWRWHNHFRNRIINGCQSLQFKTNNEAVWAILLLNPEEVQLQFFKNSFEEHSVTKAMGDTIFEYKWNYFTQKMPFLADYEADSIEMLTNGRNITPRSSSYWSFDPYNGKVPLGRIYTYRTLIDTSMLVYSHYTTETDGNKIAVISMNWKTANPNGSRPFIRNSRNEEFLKVLLNKQFEDLVQTVSLTYGEAKLVQVTGKYDSLLWPEKNGISVKLWPAIENPSEIHLILFKTLEDE